MSTLWSSQVMYLSILCTVSLPLLLKCMNTFGRLFYLYGQEVYGSSDKAMLVRILITWATRNHWITGQGGRGSPLPQWVPPARYTKTSSMASHGRPLRIIDRRCQIYPYKRFCVTLYRANALDMKWSCAGITQNYCYNFIGQDAVVMGQHILSQSGLL